MHARAAEPQQAQARLTSTVRTGDALVAEVVVEHVRAAPPRWRRLAAANAEAPGQRQRKGGRDLGERCTDGTDGR